MPVKFEAKSEYNRQFETGDPNDPPLPEFYKRPGDPKPVPSNNENRIPTAMKKTNFCVTAEPPLQHKKKPTNSESVDCNGYAKLEPPIQRKKKPIVPRGTRPIDFADNGGEVWKSGEEYVLLGNQRKFAPSIVYKAKPVSHSQEPGSDSQEDVPTPQAPRPDPTPAPRVVVDTGADTRKAELPAKQQNGVTYQQKSPAKDEPKQQNGVISNAVKAKSHKNLENQLAKSSPPKPTKSHAEPKSRQSRKDRHEARREERQQKRAVDDSELEVNGAVDPDMPAPADYALKYKAGIAAPRTRGPKRMSEYQLQFSWKRPVGASPLLDAEQVVHKSSTQLAAKPAHFSKSSVYKKEFQAWKSMPGPLVVKNRVTEAPQAKTLKRSKSAEGLSPDRLEPAGVNRVTSDHDPRLLQGSMNPLRLHFPHGPQRQYNSEYAANFAAPLEFAYEHGAWKGAKPADKKDDKTQVPSSNKPTKTRSRKDDTRTNSVLAPDVSHSKGRLPPESPSMPSASWFLEVLELRNKAQEYKKRARGTHFSREHVAQLLADQADLWDAASTSSIVSALSLEQAKIISDPPVKTQKKSLAADVSKKPPAGKRTAWGDDRAPLSETDAQSARSSVKSTSIANTYDQRSVQSDLSDAPTLVDDLDNGDADSAMSSAGRIPTPKMSDAGLRHHLDRTTPVRGGAILSSPPRGMQAVPEGEEKNRRPSSQASSTTDEAVTKPSSAAVTKGSNSQVCCTCGVDLCDINAFGSGDNSNVIAKKTITNDAGKRENTKNANPKKSIRNLNVKSRVPSAKVGKENKAVDQATQVSNKKVPQLVNTYKSQSAGDIISPTYDSEQFQSAMDVLGQLQKEFEKNKNEGKLPKSRSKSANPPKTTGKSTRPSLPFKPTQTHSDSYLVHGMHTLPVPELSLETSDVEGELSLADRLERQIHIAEDLREASRRVNSLTRPTYGMPTRDTHNLLDDQASVDRPMNTKFVHSPPAKESKHNRAKFPNVDIPDTIQESSGQLFKSRTSSGVRPKNTTNEVTLDDIPPHIREDDILSTSARSVASSCSLASEVLERARSRRDEFWGNRARPTGKA